MISKFETLFESQIDRFRRGGFLRGDYVTLKKNACSHPDIKNASKEIKESVKELIKSDLNLRISNIIPIRARQSYDLGDGPTGFLATIYSEKAPGLSFGHVTVPLEVLELKTSYYDSAEVDVPDSFVRKSTVNHTNANKKSAELADDSYDKGKDFRK